MGQAEDEKPALVKMAGCEVCGGTLLIPIGVVGQTCACGNFVLRSYDLT